MKLFNLFKKKKNPEIKSDAQVCGMVSLIIFMVSLVSILSIFKKD